MQEEWHEIKQHAEEQGLLDYDGNLIFPPPEGSVIARPPNPRVDRLLIGKEYR